MIALVLAWGLKPSIVTGDSWYASADNLKFIRHRELGFLEGIEKNRSVSLKLGKYCQVPRLDIPDTGLVVHLLEFGRVKVFKTVFKNSFRYYIMYLADLEALQGITKQEFKRVHDIHWLLETYHRAIKQVCNIERFQVRESNAIKTHIYCAIQAEV